jgi:N-methylhydantoinase B
VSWNNTHLGKVDPVTFEVLRHRLWTLNDEQGAIAARISGSPAIYEGFDFNIGILTAAGKGVFTGVYIGHHAIPLELVVHAVKERFGEDIEHGDMFFTNDPWCGAIHANDGVLAAPIFADNAIVCWTAIVMHDMDVGGPVAGSWVVGARECFGEAPLYPPIRLLKKDKIQNDVYSILRRNCRIPDKNYLNMKARISSQMMTRRRINEIIEEYGRDTFVNVLDQIINHTNFVLKSRLNQIPDGVWWEHGYLDHDGITNRIYKLVVKLIKKGTQLTFDFTGTDPQAIGSINCTSAGLRGGTLGPLLAMLCYDLPWSTGALEDIVVIKAEDGTINNATFPAGCSMASLQGAHATQHVVSNAIAKMLSCSPAYKEEAQACWQPYLTGVFTSGKDQRGQNYVDGFPDGGSGGGGARTFGDGIDCSGLIHSLRAAIPNVETNEYVQPVIEIYRQYCPDTCGHGMYRGGVGLEFAYTPLGTPEPLTSVIISASASVPSGRGLFGGYPSSINANLVLRQTNLFELFRRGFIPTGIDEIQEATKEILPAKAVTRLLPGDIHIAIITGGGGYGDPLKRKPETVCRDVANGLITEEVATRVYGVAFKGNPEIVDNEGTARLRHDILAKRKANGKLQRPDVIERLKAERMGSEDLVFVQIASDFLEIKAAEKVTGKRVICCRSCGAPICGTDTNIREYTTRSRPIPVDFLSSVNSLCFDPSSSLIEYSCPSCGTLLSVDILLKDEVELVRPEFLLD